MGIQLDFNKQITICPIKIKMRVTQMILSLLFLCFYYRKVIDYRIGKFELNHQTPRTIK